MAGKNTSTNGLHASRQGGIVPPFKLSNHDKKPLSEAINRKLNAHDIEVIESALSIFKNLRDLHFEGIASRQDIKRTLGHISNCEPDKALLALSKCDEFTRAQIEQSLWCDMQERSGIIAEMIPSAAGIALERLNNSKPTGGAPSKGYQIMFAEYSVNLWRQCGGVSMALWRKDESGELSPLLAWSVALFSSLEESQFDWKKTWTLLSAEMQRGKVSTL
jgi:hypothetical protein